MAHNINVAHKCRETQNPSIIAIAHKMNTNGVSDRDATTMADESMECMSPRFRITIKKMLPAAANADKMQQTLGNCMNALENLPADMPLAAHATQSLHEESERTICDRPGARPQTEYGSTAQAWPGTFTRSHTSTQQH